MSGITCEFLQEKLQKELNPIHVVRILNHFSHFWFCYSRWNRCNLPQWIISHLALIWLLYSSRWIRIYFRKRTKKSLQINIRSFKIFPKTMNYKTFWNSIQGDELCGECWFFVYFSQPLVNCGLSLPWNCTF